MTREDCAEWQARLAVPMTQWRGKRLFCTGGTGFFGKWLLECFLETAPEDAEMVLLTRSITDFYRRWPQFAGERRIRLVEGDVRSFSFPEGEFDAVIHAATPASARLERENPDEMYSIIVDGTRRVLDFAAKAGVSRLLLTSSGAVYGPSENGEERFSEARPARPVTAYGRGKLLAEQLVLDSGVAAVIARCFAFVGAGLPLETHFAVGNFIGDCLAGRPIVIRGDGTPRRSYLYAGELAEWLWRLLLTAPAGTICNVGAERAVSIAELAHLVCTVAGSDSPILTRQRPVPGARVEYYLPDLARAERLGLKPRISLEDALARTFQELRERGTSHADLKDVYS